MISHISFKPLLYLLLNIIVLTSCRNDDVIWEYNIPNGYEGWLAIQYDCPGGTPLNRQGNVIQVSFGEDGLFCTTDSSFSWHGQQRATSTNGDQIPVYVQPAGKTGYGVCCGQAFSSYFPAYAQRIEIVLDLMWVGNLENGYPPLDVDAIQEDAVEGQLVPADW